MADIEFPCLTHPAFRHSRVYWEDWDFQGRHCYKVTNITDICINTMIEYAAEKNLCVEIHAKRGHPVTLVVYPDDDGGAAAMLQLLAKDTPIPSDVQYLWTSKVRDFMSRNVTMHAFAQSIEQVCFFWGRERERKKNSCFLFVIRSR